MNKVTAIGLTFSIIFVLATILSVLITSYQLELLATRDIKSFYLGGTLLASGIREDFYHLQTQFHFQSQAVPFTERIEKTMPYMNPPFFAIPLTLLTLLTYQQAYIALVVVYGSVLVFIFFYAKKILDEVPKVWQHLTLALILAFIPVHESILQVQPSLLLAVSLLLAWNFLRQNQQLRAGLALSLLFIKPYLILWPVLFLLWARYFKALLSLGLVGVLLLLISWLLIGLKGLLGYFQLLQQAFGWGEAYAMHPQKMQTYLGFLQRVYQTNYPADVIILWLIGVLIIGLLTIKSWSMKSKFSTWLNLKWSILIVTMILTSTHSYTHDLSILLVVPILFVHHLFQVKQLNQKDLWVWFLIGYGLISLAIITGWTAVGLGVLWVSFIYYLYKQSLDRT